MRAAAALLLLLCAPLAWPAAAPPPPVMARSWVVGDVTSGQFLAGHKADERIEPASLTKLMTVYLVYDALRSRKLTLDQRVPVSERAWRLPGSRMFIEPGRAVTVDDLLRGMVVQSGNDAALVLAEAVAGTEERFVEAMNAQAARLAMRDTRFVNASGLSHPQHYSTASDLYRLAAALIRDFPAQYASHFAQREFRFNNITQLNRNRLLWLDPSVDGVKTGHTEAAGYCLIASSKRGARRLLSVVLGASSEAARAQESQKLLNWGFQFFDGVKLYAAGQEAKSIEVWKGSAATVKAGFAEDLVVTVPKGEAARLHVELVAERALVAPITKGQRVGTLRITHDGAPLGERALAALEPVPEAGLFGRAWDTLRLWVK